MLKQKIILNENLIVCEPIEEIREKIIKDNTFANPQYAEALKYARNTDTIEAVIETFSCQGLNIIVQRGYGRDFLNTLNKKLIPAEIIEQRSCPQAVFPALKGVSLRHYQLRAVNEAHDATQRTIVAPTEAGKSIMGLELIRRKQTPSLILLHRSELAKQWKNEVKRLFGITPGFIGAGTWEVGDLITIGMVQTLAKNEEKCRELSDKFGLILCDECHHAPARTFAQVIGWLASKFRFGLSATPTRRDKLDCLIHRVIGPTLTRISREEVEGVNSIVPAFITIVNTGHDPGSVNSWHQFCSSLNNPYRNRLVLNFITKNKATLILVDRIVHAESLSEALKEMRVAHVLAHGNLPSEKRATLMDRIKSSSITVGTTSLLGEGLDVAHWETLILAAPISSEAKLLQAIGRIVRPSEGKELGRVFDLKDDCGFAGSSLKNRLEIYKKHGINFKFNNNFNREVR